MLWLNETGIRHFSPCLRDEAQGPGSGMFFQDTPRKYVHVGLDERRPWRSTVLKSIPTPALAYHCDNAKACQPGFGGVFIRWGSLR